MADLHTGLSFEPRDVVQSDAVAALDQLNTTEHRRVHEHAARHDALICRVDAVAGGALVGGDAARGHTVVELAVPHEVSQAVDVGDRVAVKDQAEVVGDDLAIGALTGPIAFAGGEHVMLRRPG